MPVINGTCKNAAGVGLPGRIVRIDLIPDEASYSPSADFSYGDPAIVVTDAGGNWTATLVANDLIMPQAGTHYQIKEDGHVYSVVVPNAAGPFRIDDLVIGAGGSSPPPVPPDPPPSPSAVLLKGVVGIQQSYDNSYYLAAYQAGFRGCVRINCDMSGTFPTISTSNFTDVDYQMDLATFLGQPAVFTATYNPAWLGPYHGAPTNTQTWADRMGTLAARYKGRVKGYEIWNEANHGPFWSNPNPVVYTDLLKKCSIAIRAQDPDAFIVTSGTSPRSTDTTNADLTQRGYSPTDWLIKLYENGMAGFAQAIGHHPYNYPFPATYPADWNAFLMSEVLHNISVWVGNPLPVWGTEVGWPTGTEGDPYSVPTVSVSTQAARYTDAINKWRTWDWAGPIIFYAWKDDPGAGDFTTWGVNYSDGSAKPARAVLVNASLV